MDTPTRKFPVVEIFGPTIQGEGPQVGVRAAFVRFGGCDYRCAWCDSAHAVLPEDVRLARRMTAEEIVRQVRRIDVPLVVLSGGNPLLHELADVVNWLHDADYSVSVETQGSVYKPWINLLDHVVVSPKPPSSNMTHDHAILQAFMHAIQVPMSIKVPCFDSEDVQWAAHVARAFPDVPMFVSIVTLMGGLDGTYEGGHVDTRDDLGRRFVQVMKWVDDEPDLRRARVIPQLHVFAWGHDRGH